MFKIDYDKDTNVITIGKAVYDKYTPFKNSETFINHVFMVNKVATRVFNTRAQNKIVGDILGCSRSTFYKHFDKLQKKAFIAPVYDVLKKVSKFQNGQRFDDNTVARVNMHKAILNEVYADGLHNILPIVAATGKTPQELKAGLKGMWKVLSKNSLNKNRVLAEKYSNRFSVSKLEDFPKGLEKIPTTLLAYDWGNLSTVEYLANNFKGSWNKKDKMNNEGRFFTDTVRMAEELGKNVDSKWTPRRLKEEHDKMSQEITARRYPKDKFDSVSNVSVKSLELNGYTATLLDNAFSMAEEGNAMTHCVASYSSYVKDGTYLVYSVTKGGERSSTIGVNINKSNVGFNGNWPQHTLNQQYARFNKPVTDPLEKELTDVLIDQLNGKTNEN